MNDFIGIVQLMSRIKFKLWQILMTHFKKIPNISELFEQQGKRAKILLNKILEDPHICRDLIQLEKTLKFQNLQLRKYFDKMSHEQMMNFSGVISTLKKKLKIEKDMAAKLNMGSNFEKVGTVRENVEIHHTIQKNGDLLIITLYNPTGVEIEKISLNNSSVLIHGTGSLILKIDISSKMGKSAPSIVHISDTTLPDVKIHIRL